MVPNVPDWQATAAGGGVWVIRVGDGCFCKNEELHWPKVNAEWLATLPADLKRVVVDLSAVEDIDECVIGRLWRLHRHLTTCGGRLIVSGWLTLVQEKMEKARLQKFFEFAPDAQDAIRLLTEETT